MTKESELPEAPQPRRRSGWILWVLALLITMAAVVFQNRTGPTYPLEGSFTTSRGPVRFLFLRSENIGTDLAIVLRDPVPDNLRAQVRYRRYHSRDPWTVVPMQHGEFSVSRHGSSQTVSGLGVLLPSLKERAGKYEYFVEVAEGDGPMQSVTGDRPVLARYKAPVPGWALALHIVVIFLSMLLAVRVTLEALFGLPSMRLLQLTVATLILGGFILGPLVQWYAFGVWWSGFPYGYDWTDNKVAIGLLFWLLALWANRRGHRSRWTILLAGLITLAIYFIPHSIFGSEYNYLTGTGRGSAG